jgi:DNA repair protein RadC
MESINQRIAIRNWAEDDRPREKFLLKGRHSLSDAELLAILIGSGTKSQSALDLAKEILRLAHDNLAELSHMSITDMLRIKGIGQVRATTLLAALELGRRRNESEVIVKEKIRSSRDAFEIFRSKIGDKPYEEFWIILLNRANRVLRKCSISEGGISGTVVDPKKVFKIALDHHATAIILGHNHPSGNINPSEADKLLTQKMMNAGKLLEVDVIDHIILGEDQFFSFADNGVMTL